MYPYRRPTYSFLMATKPRGDVTTEPDAIEQAVIGLLAALRQLNKGVRS